MHAECQTAEIAASPQACYEALADFKRLPTWQRAVCDATVLEGGSIVEYEVDARVKRVRYRPRHVFDPPHRLASECLGGDFRDFAGEWRFVSTDRGTRVELDLRIDPGRFVPGPVRRLIADAVMRRALDDLKHHLGP